jgi:hypothetical protein
MYDRLPGLILGYHGCERWVGEAVLSGKTELKSSNNAYDWLGFSTAREFMNGLAIADS